MRHQIARVGEAREIPDFGDQGDVAWRPYLQGYF